MIRTKDILLSLDILLLLLVTFMSVVFLQPDGSLVLGLDRTYLLAGLLILVTIALAQYPKLVLVAAVLIIAIGANLPQEFARALNVDTRYFISCLIAIVLVVVANRIIKLPTGLDRRQGLPAEPSSVAPNPNLVELNLPENNDPVGDPAMENELDQAATQCTSSNHSGQMAS